VTGIGCGEDKARFERKPGIISKIKPKKKWRL